MDIKEIADLETSLEYLKKNTDEKNLTFLRNRSEDYVVGLCHHTVGRQLRNDLDLWWTKELYNKYKDVDPKMSKHKPKIVQFFNERGITHADDMSSIIIRSFYRLVNNKDIELDKQIKDCKDWWENNKS